MTHSFNGLCDAVCVYTTDLRLVLIGIKPQSATVFHWKCPQESTPASWEHWKHQTQAIRRVYHSMYIHQMVLGTHCTTVFMAMRRTLRPTHYLYQLMDVFMEGQYATYSQFQGALDLDVGPRESGTNKSWLDSIILLFGSAESNELFSVMNLETFQHRHHPNLSGLSYVQRLHPAMKAHHQIRHFWEIYERIQKMVEDYVHTFERNFGVSIQTDPDVLAFLEDCRRGIPNLTRDEDPRVAILTFVADCIFMVSVVHSADHWNTYTHFPLSSYPSRSTEHVLADTFGERSIPPSMKKMLSTGLSFMGPTLPLNRIRSGYSGRIGHVEGQRVLDVFVTNLSMYLDRFPDDPFLVRLMRSNIY